MENIYFVYKYEWSDGSIYIGQSRTDKKRFGYIPSYRTSPKVYNKMKKDPNFSKDIILADISEDNIDAMEELYIKKFNSYFEDNILGLNLTRGGKQRHNVSNETREKLRRSQMGRKYSSESKKKMSDKAKGNKSHCKKVICIETGIVYNSCKETGILHIDNVCAGTRKTAGGYHWKYWEV